MFPEWNAVSKGCRVPGRVSEDLIHLSDAARRFQDWSGGVLVVLSENDLSCKHEDNSTYYESLILCRSVDRTNQYLNKITGSYFVTSDKSILRVQGMRDYDDDDDDDDDDVIN